MSNSETPVLKPCNHCGNAERLDNTQTNDGYGVVICGTCGARGPLTENNHICESQKIEAASLWNKRANAGSVGVEEALRQLREKWPESPYVEVRHASGNGLIQVDLFAGCLRVGSGATLTEALAAALKAEENPG